MFIEVYDRVAEDGEREMKLHFTSPLEFGAHTRGGWRVCLRYEVPDDDDPVIHEQLFAGPFTQ